MKKEKPMQLIRFETRDGLSSSIQISPMDLKGNLHRRLPDSESMEVSVDSIFSTSLSGVRHYKLVSIIPASIYVYKEQK